MELWPHQERAIDDIAAAILEGDRRICLSSPTGGGKSRILCRLIEHYVERDWNAVVYTNRRMLVEQLQDVLRDHGIPCGVRAAGHADQREERVQISSLPTERHRTLKESGRWQLHGTGRKCLAIFDEAHLNTGKTAREAMQRHLEADHIILLVTATPIGLGDLADKLIVAGTNSELRECGALTKCLHYGPDEPDLKLIKNVRVGKDFTENQLHKVMMTPTIFGRVLSWYDRLNPDRRPTILFAPGVRESIGFAEQFEAHGISAAHIDGQDVWIRGRVERSSREARASVIEGSRDGNIQVICNRFVLREGIDAPWLAHGIFATVFGSIQSYLQSGGRLLRNHPSLRGGFITIQDHGGNWWRHGSLNADRHWNLDWTEEMVVGVREERLRAKKDKEPFRCPKCGLILMTPCCPQCGHQIVPGRKSRPVIQIDGTLREMWGDVFKPRRDCTRPGAEQVWEKTYYRARSARMTFAQARGLFALENGWTFPPPYFPLMPTVEADWFRRVCDVPTVRLTPKRGRQA